MTEGSTTPDLTVLVRGFCDGREIQSDVARRAARRLAEML
jgi:hypothetical protein